MLKVAVTNHWAGFAACKLHNHPDKFAFFWFDSRDEDNLGWNKFDVEDYVEARHQEKIRIKDKFQWLPFHISSHKASRIDI